jgi:hypothetical protein
MLLIASKARPSLEGVIIPGSFRFRVYFMRLPADGERWALGCGLAVCAPIRGARLSWWPSEPARKEGRCLVQFIILGGGTTAPGAQAGTHLDALLPLSEGKRILRSTSRIRFRGRWYFWYRR